LSSASRMILDFMSDSFIQFVIPEWFHRESIPLANLV
jgi:hypothetical protein